VDALLGEPVAFEEMLDDLQQARVIYLGEYHTIARHPQLQKELLEALARRGTRLVLAIEHFEHTAQPVLDRFADGSIDLDGLVQETNLRERWPAYTNHLPLLAAAARADVPLLALNARAELIRSVARKSLAGLAPEERRELPEVIVTDDPLYERLLNRTLAVHMAFDPEKLRPIYEAQVARDEAMAARLSAFLGSPAGRDRVALVVCGRGHCEFGLGMPARVERRIPSVIQRILLFSQSGDLRLSEEERKQARQIEIPRQFLRELGRPPGDYFHVVELPPPSVEEAGGKKN
jgi:uncharacterized iron-regulated protein